MTAPRLRQAVLAAHRLEPVVDRLREEHGLGEPFSDPAVQHFGLENAVFAIGDTFLEVVSPVQAGTAAGRLLERRGGDCGYMAMFEVDDLAAARERAREAGVREVFAVDLEDIAEVHLHPVDIGGAIVAVSRPRPPGAWRWGGPGWEERSVEGRISGIVVAVADPDAVRRRWEAVLGGTSEVAFVADDDASGLVAIDIHLGGRRARVGCPPHPRRGT